MTQSTTYHQVCLNLPSDQIYTYRSDNQKLIRKRVQVEFGKRREIGLVVDSSSTPPSDFPASKIKVIEEVLDRHPVISKKQFDFARWISFYYLTSLGEALGLFLSFSKSLKTDQSEKTVTTVTGKVRPVIDEVILTEGQQNIYQQYQKYLAMGQRNFLLHGITGSGKTYFFLKLAVDKINTGKQVLILVPEISLTWQVMATCRQFLDERCIAIYHSKISLKLRKSVKDGVKSNDIKLVISTRSGLFLDYQNLGMLVIDEEHESSYKSDSTPRYQVKRVAFYLAQKSSSELILASATPTIETYYQAKLKQLALLEMKERYQNYLVSDHYILHNSKNELLMEEIQKKIFQVLRRKKQVLIYINQRGYSSSVFCQNCEEFENCPECDLTLTFHKKSNVLLCHYCGFKAPFDGVCSSCGSKSLDYIKPGTEQIDQFLKKRFQDYTIGRFDSDTLNNPKKMEECLDDFSTGKIDILVGTQMIIKGHDFKQVALVVVLDPEKYLLFPDYRSSERCFSHLVQVAGRAGRNEEKEVSEMLIQTRQEDNYAIKLAQTNDYLQFYQTELDYRKMFHYPPFVRLVRMVFRGSDQQKVISFSKEIKEILYQQFGEVLILGPSPCLIERQKKYYRWNIILKIKKLKLFLNQMQSLKPKLKSNSQVYTEIDIDPVQLL